MRVRSLAVLAVLALLALTVAPAFAADTTKDLIVGKWQPLDEKGAKAVLEFTKEGKVKISSDQFNLEGTYKFVKDDQVEVALKFGDMEQKVKLNVKVTKDELSTKEDGKDKEEKFKRVK